MKVYCVAEEGEGVAGRHAHLARQRPNLARHNLCAHMWLGGAPLNRSSGTTQARSMRGGGVDLGLHLHHNNPHLARQHPVLIAANLYDEYSVELSMRPICSRCCFTMTRRRGCCRATCPPCPPEPRSRPPRSASPFRNFIREP